jgi:hypothetical protein
MTSMPLASASPGGIATMMIDLLGDGIAERITPTIENDDRRAA